MSDRAATLAKMSALLTGKQQFLVTHRKGAGWSTLHKTGAGWDFAAGSARLAVLKEAENKGEVVMVLDAQMDERLREHRYSPFRSALCIPIVKSWGVAALIFAEEPDRAQAFTFREAALWQPLADELRESLPDTRPEVGGLPSLSPKAVAGVAGVLFGCMVLSWALRPLPPAPKPKPAFEVPQANQLAPDVVLNGCRRGPRGTAAPDRVGGRAEQRRWYRAVVAVLHHVPVADATLPGHRLDVSRRLRSRGF